MRAPLSERLQRTETRPNVTLCRAWRIPLTTIRSLWSPIRAKREPLIGNQHYSATSKGEKKMSAPAAAVRPVVVELGSQRRSRIRALKRGEGRLMDDLARAMQKIRADSP